MTRAFPEFPRSRSPWPMTTFRLVLGVVFFWPGVEKIVHSTAFFSSLLDYKVPFPEIFIRIVAIALPWLEVFCGVAFLVNAWAETVRPLVSMLCLVFVLMLGQAILRGVEISNCGCFGPSANTWIDHPAVAFLRAVALFVCSLYLLLPRTLKTR